MSAVVP